VLKTVAKIAGTEKNEPGTGGKSNPGGSLLGARDEGLASVTATDGEPGVAKDKTKTKGETKAGAGAGGPGAPKANADKPAKERPPA
jgi:hypothetical protein